jgi:hypothetical protein
MIGFSNPDSIEKTKRKRKTGSPDRRGIMFTFRKMIVSGSLWLLAAFILPLCLAVPAPCAAASAADLAARTHHRLLASEGDTDLPELLILKPPPPPPARA